MTNLTKEKKGELYEEYLNGRSRKLEVHLTKGPKIHFSKVWDIKDMITTVTFKTLTKPMLRPRLTFEEVDLMPVAKLTYYQVTITR